MKTFLSFLLISIPFFLYPQSDTLDLDKFLEEVLKSEIEKMKQAEDLTYGTEVQIISDQKELEKLRSNIQKRRQEAEEAIQKELDKNPGAKYKRGDKSVVPELIDILQGDDSDLRWQVYMELDRRYEDPEDYQINEPELVAAIYANLDKERDFKSIVQLAGFTKLPGYVEVFENLLIEQKAFELPRIIFWLGSDGSSMKGLDLIAEQMLAEKIELGGWQRNNAIMGLERYLENGNEEVQAKVLKLLWDLYEKNKYGLKDFAEKASEKPKDYQRELFDLLFEHADKRILPLAEKFFHQGIMELAAGNCLLRLEPLKYEHLLLHGLSFKDQTYSYINVLVNKFDATREVDILKDIFKEFEAAKHYRDYELGFYIAKLWDRKQDQLMNDLEKFLTKKSLIEEAREIYAELSLNMEDWAQEILEMGVISSPFSPEDLERAKAKDKETPHARLYNLLEASKLLIWFDAEASIVPLDYDSLILEFADHSRGVLQGLEVWLDAKEADEYEYNYTVTLFFQGKAYIAKASDSGDWYELSMVIGLLNTVLEDNQRLERFNDIFTGDQTAQYIFGPPKEVQEFAIKHDLHSF